jgi:hypothetical protein
MKLILADNDGMNGSKIHETNLIKLIIIPN